MGPSDLASTAEEDQTLLLPGGRIWQRRKGEVLDPQRAPLSFLNEMKLMQGPRSHVAQYQQNPIVADGGLIDYGWFGQYHERPDRSLFHNIVQSIDPAITETSRPIFLLA